jgi:hypothetical protein
MQYSMTMKNYKLFTDRVIMFLTNGQSFTVYFTKDSGKIFYRFKIDTISNVKHTGILLGIDSNGNRLYMHNHFQTGRPAIDSERNFSKGMPLYRYEQQPSNPPLKIIEYGLQQVLEGKEYNWLNYNCQVYTNLAANNQAKSESVNNWVGGLLLAGIALFGIKALNN